LSISLTPEPNNQPTGTDANNDTQYRNTRDELATQVIQGFKTPSLGKELCYGASDEELNLPGELLGQQRTFTSIARRFYS
jgi:hypothetical protein